MTNVHDFIIVEPCLIDRITQNLCFDLVKHCPPTIILLNGNTMQTNQSQTANPSRSRTEKH